MRLVGWLFTLLLSFAACGSKAMHNGCGGASDRDGGVEGVVEWQRDSGSPDDPVDSFPLVGGRVPMGWLDGGGFLAVRGAWHPSLQAHSACRIGESGRLFMNTGDGVVSQGALRYVLVSENTVLSAGPENGGVSHVGWDDSVTWCSSSFVGRPEIRCQRQFVDGGIELAPKGVFDLTSWTSSGFVAGDFRTGPGESVMRTYLSDGGVFDGPVRLRLKESGTGVGQFTPSDGGSPYAVIFRLGRLFRLEPGLAGADSTWAADTNDDGLVVGQRFVGGANSGAVFWAGETATLPKARGFSADLRAVNRWGLAVGQERSADGRSWAVTWYQGKLAYLDDLLDAGTGCGFTDSNSVNDSNSIAALHRCVDGGSRCVRVDFELRRTP
jgi:hypothetical protein